MKRIALLTMAALLIVGILSAEADTLLLKSGGKLTGDIVEETDETVTLQIGGTTMTLQRDTIREIVRNSAPSSGPPTVGRSVDKEYEKRLARLQEDNALSQFELAVWCRRRRLISKAIEHLEKAATCKPPHPKAQAEAAELGAFLVGEKLYTADDLLSTKAPEMTDAQKVAVWEEMIAADAVEADAKRTLITRLAELHERDKNWAAVARLWPQFAELSKKAASGTRAAALISAINKIAEDHPDGTYEVLGLKQAARDIGVDKLDPDLPDPDIATGTRPLAATGVLEVAIRDVALASVVEGKEMIATVSDMVSLEPARAIKSGLPDIEKIFARAEAMAPGVSRPYAAETVRIRLKIYMTQVEDQLTRAETEAPWRFPYSYWVGSGNLTPDSKRRLAVQRSKSLKECEKAIRLAKRVPKVPEEYAEALKEDIRNCRRLYERALTMRTRIKEYQPL